MKDFVSSFVKAWSMLVDVRPPLGELIPWWLDRSALMTTFARAAESVGWQAQPLDGDWDMRLQGSGRVLIRCAGAGVNLDQMGRDVIGDTWRVLDLMPSPPKGTSGLHLLVAIPFMGDDSDARVRAAVARWRVAYPAMTWVDAPEPLPRNQARLAFPGLGLLAREAPGS